MKHCHPLHTTLVLCAVLLVSYGCGKNDASKPKPASQSAVKLNPLDVVLNEEMAKQSVIEPAQIVELDPAAGELRPVKKGINEGTLIVVDGSFHLNSQRKRAELE